jgi:hypothetical protein
MSPYNTSRSWFEQEIYRQQTTGDQRRSASLSFLYQIQQENDINAAALHLLPTQRFSQHLSINFNSLLNFEDPPHPAHLPHKKQYVSVLPIDYDHQCYGLLFIRHNEPSNITKSPLLQTPKLSLFALSIQTINNKAEKTPTDSSHNCQKITPYLSQQEFYAAVHYCVKHYHESNLLLRSPLLTCSLLNASIATLNKSPLKTLKNKIDGHIQHMLSIDTNPNLGWLIKHCYIDKDINPEQLAERMNKSISSVRRYLKQAKEQLAAELYQEELLARQKQKAEPPQ